MAATRTRLRWSRKDRVKNRVNWEHLLYSGIPISQTLVFPNLPISQSQSNTVIAPWSLQQICSTFQQAIAPNRGQGGQKYSKCIKMTTPTSLCYNCSNALKGNVGKGVLPDTTFRFFGSFEIVLSHFQTLGREMKIRHGGGGGVLLTKVEVFGNVMKHFLVLLNQN